MSGHGRDTLVLVVVSAGTMFLSGCGCEMYSAKATADGEGYAIESPDRKVAVTMEWKGAPFQSEVLDATPTPGRGASVCLALTKPYLDADIRLRLDYSLELGVLQSGTQAPSGFGCNSIGPIYDPENPTMVYGSIEFEGKEVELDSVEARSTSLKPPRYDVKLGGKDAEGKAYEFELEVKLDRAGNAVFCD